MVSAGEPIWQWLRDAGGWRSTVEILEAFGKDDVKSKYDRSEGYTDTQIRSVVGTGAYSSLYNKGLAFVRTQGRRILCRAVGLEEDRAT